MIWPSSMEKRWFRRFVSLVSLTLGNSVSSLNWLKLREEVRHDRLSDTLQMILVDLIG